MRLNDRMLKRLWEFIRGTPGIEQCTPPTLSFSEPTLRTTLDSLVFHVLALAFVSDVDPGDAVPLLDLFATRQRWDDYVRLDDSELLPSERSVAIQRVASELCPGLTKRQAARYIAYRQVKGLSKYDLAWSKLASWDPDLKPFYAVSFMDEECDQEDFRALGAQLIAEFENSPAPAGE